MLRRRPVALALAGGLLGCSLPAIEMPEPVPARVPGDPEVVRVIFLVGDAGNAAGGDNPTLHRVRDEVAAWSTALAADSAVAVVFLGDNVYPNGVRSSGVGRTEDLQRLKAQIDVVATREAIAARAIGLFVAGNHDWGGMQGSRGAERLRNEEEAIARHRDDGVHVDLLPPATDPGPEVVDLGTVKLVAVDTQWWLTNGSDLRRHQALEQIRTALDEPADRLILFAAHHPPTTGGSHGGYIPFWPTFGLQKLAHLTGTVGQDVTARPYQRMIADFRAAFLGVQATVLYAAGHEHSLQVIRGTERGDPDWIAISGAGSKVSPVEGVNGSEFFLDTPGFMRLIVLRDSRVLLEVAATGRDYVACPEAPASSRSECLSEGAADFRTVESVEVRSPSG